MTHGCGPFVSKVVGKSVKFQLKLPWKSVKKTPKNGWPNRWLRLPVTGFPMYNR